MKQAIYLYQASLSRGEMLLANDSSSFTLPFFEKVQEILAKVHCFPLSENVSCYPNNVSEDSVMELSRTDFHFSEWLLPALIVDEDDELSTALLINRAHPENVLVISLKNKEIVVRCLNGVEICEEEGEAMSGKEFLSTLSLPTNLTSFSPEKQNRPTDLGYYVPSGENQESDDDDSVYIDIARPAFEPSCKKGTLDLGSSYNLNGPMEEEEDDGPVHIEVVKESFSAGSSKKPRDLGSYSRKRRIFSPNSEMEKEESSQEEIANSFTRPAFEPNVQPKAPASQTSFVAPKVPNQRKYGEKENEKAAEPVLEKKGQVLFAKPDFVPNNNKKPENVLSPSNGRNQRPNPAESSGRPETKTVAQPSFSPKVEKFHSFCRKKDIHGSNTIFNDPALMFVSRKFVREGERRFGSAPKNINSSETVFVAIDEKERQSFLEKALAPTIDSWDLLALNIEKNGMPYAYLLANKEDQLLCAIYEVNEKDDLSLTYLTHNGISVEDPSLDYKALRSLCFPGK